MQIPTPSAAAITDRIKKWIERMVKTMDPDFPSAVVPASGGGVDDPTQGLEGKQRPGFVVEDEKGWTV